jgi:hypothetical protein
MLGAAPLRTEVEALAARSRLDLTADAESSSVGEVLAQLALP